MAAEVSISAAALAAVLALAASAALALVPGPAEPPPPPAAEPPGRHVQCLERRNGCEVCRRDGSGTEHCSLPGIACQPEAWRCITSGAGRVDSQPPR
jgi:hypothetical protein